MAGKILITLNMNTFLFTLHFTPSIDLHTLFYFYRKTCTTYNKSQIVSENIGFKDVNKIPLKLSKSKGKITLYRNHTEIVRMSVR